MPFKHPTDRQAYRRAYYRAHAQQLKEQAAEWHDNHKGESEYKLRKREYMVIWRRRRKNGI